MLKEAVERYLIGTNCDLVELARAAVVAESVVEDWLKSEFPAELDRAHINRIAWAIAWLYEQHGDDAAIDHIDTILSDLLSAAGHTPFPTATAA